MFLRKQPEGIPADNLDRHMRGTTGLMKRVLISRRSFLGMAVLVTVMGCQPPTDHSTYSDTYEDYY
jgi:hypothetical protein